MMLSIATRATDRAVVACGETYRYMRTQFDGLQGDRSPALAHVHAMGVMAQNCVWTEVLTPVSAAVAMRVQTPVRIAVVGVL
jgi:hypothetical protein